MTNEDQTAPVDGVTAHTIPAPADDVYPHTVRARFAADPGFAAAETSLLHRNGIDPQRVVIDTYERHGAEVSYQYAVVDHEGRKLVATDEEDPTGEGKVLVVSNEVRTLEVYP